MDSYVRKAVIEVFAKNIIISGLISLTLSFILSIQLIKQLSDISLYLWLALLVFVYVIRFTLSKRMLKDFNQHVAMISFRVGCLLSGLIWGWCGFFFFLDVDTVTRIYISFTLGGLAAGASSSLSADKYSFLLFTLPVLVPNIVANFIIGSEESIGMALMLILFLGFITFSSKTMGATLIENLSLKQKAEKSEKEVRRLAYYDQLTGLPNRFLFEDRLNQVLKKHKRDKNKFSLLFLDLDGFKCVNDNYGHRAGDQLLKELSGKFQNTIRNEDTIARIGGDEFVAILQNITSDGAIEVSRKLLKAACSPVCISNDQVQVSASIGVAIYPDHALTVDDLLIKSDKFMYLAKEKGKGTMVMGDMIYV